MIFTVILFIVILGVLVFVHEFGHFWSARRLGVQVDEFGFGFPPKLFSITRGRTIYSINLIPFGGFVRLKGEQGPSTGETDSFQDQRASKRFAILASGVGMNVLLAAVLFSLVFAIGVPTMLGDTAIPRGGRVQSRQIEIVEVLSGSPSAAAGLQTGDSIKSLAGEPVASVTDIQGIIDRHPGQSLMLELERDQQSLSVAIMPAVIAGSSEPRLGVGLAETGLVTYPWYQAFWLGPWYALRIIWLIVVSLYQLLANLIQHGTVSGDVTGPIGIAVVTGQVAGLGLTYILQFAALLSLSLAVMNVLPLPGLDGGRILFVLIEKLRGRPINQRVEGLVHTIGFYALLLLIIAISYRDFFRYGLNIRIHDFIQRIIS